jgi:hypothetical protein
MAKDKTWVDYAILGSNVAQNIQLRDLQQKLGGMASLAVREQAVAGIEDQRREIVFKANSNLAGMRALVAENRAGVLAIVKQTLADFEEYGISSACFRAYEDKERVGALIEGYEALADECGSALTLDERKEAILCAQYLTERTDLNELIRFQQKQEELESAKSELQILEAKAKPARAILLTGQIVGFFGLVLLVIWLAMGEPWTVGLGILAFGVLVAAVAAFSESHKLTEIQKAKVEELKVQTRWLKNSFERSADWGEKLVGKSALELESMKLEREALITKVLKVTDSGALTGLR